MMTKADGRKPEVQFLKMQPFIKGKSNPFGNKVSYEADVCTLYRIGNCRESAWACRKGILQKTTDGIAETVMDGYSLDVSSTVRRLSPNGFVWGFIGLLQGCVCIYNSSGVIVKFQ